MGALVLILVFGLVVSFVGFCFNSWLLFSSSVKARGGKRRSKVYVGHAVPPSTSSESSSRGFPSPTKDHKRVGVWTRLKRSVGLAQSETDFAPCANCLRRHATMMCLPCGDLCMCIVCAEEFFLRITGGSTGLKCPSCQRSIETIIDAKPASMFESVG